MSLVDQLIHFLIYQLRVHVLNLKKETKSVNVSLLRMVNLNSELFGFGKSHFTIALILSGLEGAWP